MSGSTQYERGDLGHGDGSSVGQAGARRRERLGQRRLVTVRRSVPLPITLESERQIQARAVSFSGIRDGGEHLAVLFAKPDRQTPTTVPLVRVHSECLTGDVFGSARCDCGPQLRGSMEVIAGAGGIIIYLRQEGRGIGLYNKLDAYQLQDHGLDTFAANRALSFAHDLREYAIAAEMLNALGAPRIRLITNNPDKVAQLANSGIEVLEVVPTPVHLSAHNGAYLLAKQHLGHTISVSPSVS
jgi:GTP cyclohydrolase II